VTRRDAYEAAAQVLQRYGIYEIPVPVEQIALNEGVQLVRQRFEGDQSGFMYRHDGHKIIGINSTHSRRRQRFTIAHEIGHLELHQQDLIVDRAINYRDRTSALGIDQAEIDANAFAASLLMPADLVLQAVKSATGDPSLTTRERLVSHLAQLFDVSAEAMSYRLINLGIYS
jgi:Zn-dependent peptidase ImmA (M78 family)